MNIKAKLILGFIGVAAIAALVGVVGLVNINSLAAQSEFMYLNQTMPLGQLVHIMEGFQRQRINIRDMLEVDDSLELQAFETTINELSSEVEHAYEQYQSTMTPGRG